MLYIFSIDGAKQATVHHYGKSFRGLSAMLMPEQARKLAGKPRNWWITKLCNKMIPPHQPVPCYAIVRHGPISKRLKCSLLFTNSLSADFVISCPFLDRERSNLFINFITNRNMYFANILYISWITIDFSSDIFIPLLISVSQIFYFNIRVTLKPNQAIPIQHTCQFGLLTPYRKY